MIHVLAAFGSHNVVRKLITYSILELLWIRCIVHVLIYPKYSYSTLTLGSDNY